MRQAFSLWDTCLPGWTSSDGWLLGTLLCQSKTLPSLIAFQQLRAMSNYILSRISVGTRARCEGSSRIVVLIRSLGFDGEKQVQAVSEGSPFQYFSPVCPAVSSFGSHTGAVPGAGGARRLWHMVN